MTASVTPSEELVPKPDLRLVRLREFFQENRCPVEPIAHEFLTASDQNHLDWRLLPSISFVESTCGKAARNNNLFGWNNGDKRFRTVREGIHLVAQRLGNSTIYRGKSVQRKLEIYNPVGDYPTKVQSVMRRISQDRRLLVPVFAAS